jgi:hypothetical protein
MHSERDLADLWSLIEGERCSVWGKFIGLVAVPFGLNKYGFAREHRRENLEHHGAISEVYWDVPSAIQRLENALVHYHHLTCAAGDDIRKEDTAVCIHFWDTDEPELQVAMAIPGVNYAPTRDTLEQWDATGQD